MRYLIPIVFMLTGCTGNYGYQPYYVPAYQPQVPDITGWHNRNMLYRSLGDIEGQLNRLNNQPPVQLRRGSSPVPPCYGC